MNKHPILLCVLFYCLATSDLSWADTPDISGIWKGTLSAAQYNPVELIFTIVSGSSADGANHSATLDIPSQFRAGLPVASVSLRENSITLRLPALQAEFHGYLEFAEDGSTVLALDGDWSQSGEYVPLRLERSQQR
jgi:uncharacterized protein